MIQMLRHDAGILYRGMSGIYMMPEYIDINAPQCFCVTFGESNKAYLASNCASLVFSSDRLGNLSKLLESVLHTHYLNILYKP